MQSRFQLDEGRAADNFTTVGQPGEIPRLLAARDARGMVYYYITITALCIDDLF